MPQVELDNAIFGAVQRKAVDAGYSSVDEYVADVIFQDVTEDNDGITPEMDYLFTAERLRHIDEAAAEIKSGNYFTAEQVREHFKRKRAAWTRKNSHP